MSAYTSNSRGTSIFEEADFKDNRSLAKMYNIRREDAHDYETKESLLDQRREDRQDKSWALCLRQKHSCINHNSLL